MSSEANQFFNISKDKFVSSNVLAYCSFYCKKLHCRSAQYYVDLLKLIAQEGSMSVLHDERERVLIIMESVGKLAKLKH